MLFNEILYPQRTDSSIPEQLHVIYRRLFEHVEWLYLHTCGRVYLGRVTLFANNASLKLQWTAMAVWLTAVVSQVWEKVDGIVSVTSACTYGLSILSVRKGKRKNDLSAA